MSNTNFYTNMIPASARVIMVRAIDDFDTESESAIVYRDEGDLFATNLDTDTAGLAASAAGAGAARGTTHLPNVRGGSAAGEDVGL